MALSVAAGMHTPPPGAFFDVDHKLDKESEKIEQRQRIWARLREWAKRDKQPDPMPNVPAEKPDTQHDTQPTTQPVTQPSQTEQQPECPRRLSRKVGVGIPRSTTFLRQEEEQRKNLEPIRPDTKEKRSVSKGRQRALSAQPVPPKSLRRQGSAPEVGEYHTGVFPSIEARMNNASAMYTNEPRPDDNASDEEVPPPIPPPVEPHADTSVQHTDAAMTELSYDDVIDEEIREELERKWILNLSMHFRDKSPREKFFLTYAETPQKWRRVTISIDYRDAPPDSLESDLQALNTQRDKSARVYESIRMSLNDIQFYETVTNLKLETKDDRLHVHVTEDVNEIIQYPSSRSIHHLSVNRYCESELHFVEHMSGFVYKVDVGRHTWIKKEIPGPDSVDEFLYEINALNDLIGSRNVIELKGLVVSDDGTLVKGLLIGYADKGALVDIIYDHRGQTSWGRRERWAKQIIRGLSEIHEAGFVQGDFTISNIVIDSKDRAKIIDINRRGCPVGWEPPEIGRLIENGQRISMFIGVKTDLFQLGMVLWALAMEEDEPERQEKPLLSHELPDEIPSYYRDLLSTCLSSRPADRLSAKELLDQFPAARPNEDENPTFLNLTGLNDNLQTTIVPQISNQEIDLTNTSMVDFPSIKAEKFQALGLHLNTTPFSHPIELDEHGLIPQNSSNFSPFEELNDDPLDRDRGRQPYAGDRHFSISTEDISPGASEVATPNVIAVSPNGDRKWEEITLDGGPYLIHRDTLDSLEDEDELDLQVVEQPSGEARRDLFREVRGIGEIEHVDSGLADMDLGAEEPSSEPAVRTLGRTGTDETIQGATAQHTVSATETPQKETGLMEQSARTNDEQQNHQETEKPQPQSAKGITDDLGSSCEKGNVDTGLRTESGVGCSF